MDKNWGQNSDVTSYRSQLLSLRHNKWTMLSNVLCMASTKAIILLINAIAITNAIAKYYDNCDFLANAKQY